MAFLRFLIWTGISIAIGVFIARYDVGGKTPLDHMERAWKQKPNLDDVKEGVEDAVEGAKKTVAGRDDRPIEHHTHQDKDAVNKIIAKRKM